MNDNCTPHGLYSDLAPQLRGFILKRVGDKALAEDLTQETFLKVVAYCNKGKDCSYPKAFLYQSASNLVADYFRRNEKIEIAPAEEIENEEPQNDLNAQVIACLLPLIERLPSPYKEAVKLADLDGLPQQQIANRMKISLSGAKSRVQRGRAKLKELLLSSCSITNDCYGNILSCDSQ